MLTYFIDGPVAWATLERVDELKAMPRSFSGEQHDVLKRANDDPEVRVLVFRGDGRAFSAGGDIAGIGELTHAADMRQYLRQAFAATRSVGSMPRL